MKCIKKMSSVMLVIMMIVSMTVSTFAATLDTSGKLKEGSSGTQVKYLQYNLNGLGYNVGTADGKFGPKTKNAVKRYQAASNLSVDGIAGVKTLTSIKNKVSEIQKNLKTLKYYSGSVDGIYGSATKAAVKKFQSQNNLTVDGIAGSKTTKALKNAVKKATTTTTTKPSTTTTTKPTTTTTTTTKPTTTTTTKPSTTTTTKPATANKVYQVSVRSLYQTGDYGIIRYGSGRTTTVASSGCGGVSLAMALNALKNKSTYTGKNVMQWMADNGYYYGSGTTQSGLCSYATRQGLKAKYADTSSTLISELKKGAVAIAIVKDKTGHQYFANATSSGHYILISGFRTQNGVNQVYVNNPMRSKVSGWYDLDKLEKNVKTEKEGYANSYVIISK